MGKSGVPPRERERKVKRLDKEIVEKVCPWCDGRGVARYIHSQHDEEYDTCDNCEGLGVVYAEE
jgi:DnaJ-class molecular chaperone